MSPSAVIEVPHVRLAEAVGTPFGLVQALGTCLHHTSRPWAPAILGGLCGHAFESTWGLEGIEVWTYGSLEWYHHDDSVRRVGLDVHRVQKVKGPDGTMPPAAELNAALDDAFEAVTESVARGVPALIWQPMTRAQRDAHRGWMWGPVGGVDRDSGDYLVLDREGTGTFRTPHREAGQIVPVEWLCVYTFADPAQPVDDAEVARGGLAWAVALLSGESAGSEMPAEVETLRHGTAGLSAWADEVEEDGAAEGSLRSRAGEWAKMRGLAVGFCAWAAGVVPSEAAAAVREVGAALQAQADALARIADGAGDEAPTLSREAAQLQARAVDSLRQALRAG